MFDTATLNQLDSRDIARKLLGDPVRSSRKYDKYYSPFRPDGRKAALTVYPDGFKDYGGKGQMWNNIAFVQMMLNCDFIEACEWLNGQGNHIPTIQPQNHIHHAEKPSKAWQSATLSQIEKYEGILWSMPAVLDYLRVERGLSDETIKHYRLGYNPSWDEFRADGTLCKVAPGIVIPWISHSEIVAVRIRTHTDQLAIITGQDDSYLGNKYMSITGSRQSAGLFGATQLQGGKPVIITEGEFDAMLATQELGITAVTRGSAGDHHHISAEWLKRLDGASVIYGLLDTDAVGQQANEALRKQLDTFIAVQLPQGKDIGEYLIKHNGSVDALRDEMLHLYEQVHEASFDYAKSYTPIEQAEIAYQAGQYRSWWTTESIPMWWRSALLFITSGNTPLVTEKLHRAFMTGKLRSQLFTLNDVLQVTESSRPTITKMLQSLEELGFIKVLNIDDNLKELYSDVLQNGGRTPTLYAIDDNFELISQAQLKRVLAKSYYADVIALPEKWMADDAGLLSRDEFTAWQNAVSDVVDWSAHYAFKREIEGDGLAWCGWNMALQSEETLAIDLASCETLADYRAVILRAVIEREQAFYGECQLAQSDLMRVIGTTTTGTLHSIYRRAAITTIMQTETAILRDYTNPQPEIEQAQKQYRGKVMNITINSPYSEKSHELDLFRDTNWREVLSQLGAESRITMTLRVASKQIPMDKQEYERQQTEKDTDEAIEEVKETTQDEEVEDEKEPKPRIDFITKQLMMSFDALTDYMLMPDLMLLDGAGQVVRDGLSRRECVEILVRSVLESAH